MVAVAPQDDIAALAWFSAWTIYWANGKTFGKYESSTHPYI